MNISRLSTLSLTIVLFALGTLVLPADIASAHHCKGGHRNGPGCDGGSGGGGTEVGATFSALITGDVNGGTIDPVSGNEDKWTKGGKGVGQNTSSGIMYTNIDLSFLDTYFGNDCFNAGRYYPGQVSVRKGKKGTAEAWFWFIAADNDGNPGVGYLFQTFGYFIIPNPGWPPGTQHQHPLRGLGQLVADDRR